MSFKDIKGQDGAIEALKSSIRLNKISHAYMFIGPSGVGKKLAALNFAKALNCLGPKDEGSCDTCAQCKKIEAGNHPDVLISSPVKKDSSFGIDKIRAITKDVGLKPYEGRKKVYILEGASSMTHEAQNALLKTLEEPFSESILILIAESPGALFPTIQSRVQRVRFFPIAANEISKILVDRYKLDKEKAEVLSRISSGELDRALKFNDEDFFRKRAHILDSLKPGAFPGPDFEGLSKSDIRLVLDMMLTWYRDILVCKAACGRVELVNVDRADIIRGQAAGSDLGALDNIINQIILTGSFLEQNANPKLAMGVLGISIAHL
ncbi:MAG: DNA polymerase III subunit delta' [Candidatus Omnitrophota bacterium]|nr:DNA polymerase III subunit delta' [Candidatus Omnitrophota bacterium]